MTTKYDSGKPRPTLLPFNALDEVIGVLEFGAVKYSRDDWKTVPDAKQRYTDAMLRHVLQYAKGEYLDDESHASHLAHAVCCAMFLIELEQPELSE